MCKELNGKSNRIHVYIPEKNGLVQISIDLLLKTDSDEIMTPVTNNRCLEFDNQATGQKFLFDNFKIKKIEVSPVYNHQNEPEQRLAI